jgi:hypothetical protein
VTAPQELASTLTEVTPLEYVRFVADWIVHADDLDRAPNLSGVPEIDALAAAAAAHVALSRGARAPAWVDEPERYAATLWYPGPDVLFANALVHSPLSFLLHGVLVETDSLVSL